jgi:hypothetical protein
MAMGSERGALLCVATLEVGSQAQWGLPGETLSSGNQGSPGTVTW